MTSTHLFDRRRFLQSGTAVALAAAVPVTHAAEKRTDPYGGFLLGVQSYTFRSFDLEPALKRTQALGLKYAEFYSKHIPLTASPAQRQAFLKLCKEYGVTPRAFGVQSFTGDHARNQRVFEFGKAIGVRMFSADPTPDSFDSLDKLCDEYKIAIGIHPHGPGGRRLHRWYSAEKILEAVKNHHPLIGSCLDTGHLIRAAILDQKLDPAEQIRVMGARNFGIHLKDNDNEAEKRGASGGRSNVVLGKGVLDVPSVLKALRDVKFQGLVSIEYEANPQDPSSDVRACLTVVKESIKKLA